MASNASMRVRRWSSSCSNSLNSGFKRLNEGEKVEFKLLEQGNGDAKAVEVTQPGGDPIRNDLKRGGSRRAGMRTAKGDEPLMEGEVVWFDPIAGYGWISFEDSETDAYVGYQDIIGDGFRTLLDGEEVEFKLVDQ